MKFTIIFACLLLTGVAAKEKQLKLEDIERDNIASERKTNYNKPTNAQYQTRQGPSTPAPKMQYGFVPMKNPPNYVPRPLDFAHYSTQTESYPRQYVQQQQQQIVQVQQAYTHPQYSAQGSQPKYTQALNQYAAHAQSAQPQTTYLTQAQLNQYVQAHSQPQFQQYSQDPSQIGQEQFAHYTQALQSQLQQFSQTQQQLTSQLQAHDVPSIKAPLQYQSVEKAPLQYQSPGKDQVQYESLNKAPVQYHTQDVSSLKAPAQYQAGIKAPIQYQTPVQYVPHQPIQYVVDNQLPQSTQEQKFYSTNTPQYVYLQQPSQEASNSIQSIVDTKGNVQYVMYVPISQLKGDPNYASLLQNYATSEEQPQQEQQYVIQTPAQPTEDVKYAPEQAPAPVKYSTGSSPLLQSRHQPKSLLDSYVPSYLQYQYYKQQQESGNTIKAQGVKLSGGIGKSELLKAHKNSDVAGSQVAYRLQHPTSYLQQQQHQQFKH